ncbi:hypothetical protein HFX_1063 [Haloferax mediterranei ATCC 33500]|uniref:Uncharacterized protein n=1 Tax=Haloferax mediterranei (strain ATCC 33500 / DSM 1411 / JCM 8866 / NBRC 14739 / NCIMB 2177 / R-4) TaxID=523841 RepID=I3R3H0_HALMT|nr:hypothetical protein HFX_1063 [Haloferax mediterranei ATCC 33500]
MHPVVDGGESEQADGPDEEEETPDERQQDDEGRADGSDRHGGRALGTHSMMSPSVTYRATVIVLMKPMMARTRLTPTK